MQSTHTGGCPEGVQGWSLVERQRTGLGPGLDCAEGGKLHPIADGAEGGARRVIPGGGRGRGGGGRGEDYICEHLHTFEYEATQGFIQDFSVGAD